MALYWRLILVLLGSVVLQVSILGCGMDSDETSELACQNASCPPGTTMDMNAQSVNQCEGAGSFEVGIDSRGGSATAKCYSEGSCVYVCIAPHKCCGNESWTTTSYSCITPCCSDGNPPPCGATACGNGSCEAGENPETCPQDCGDTCGDGLCTGSEDPTECPGDCGGAG